MGKVQIDAVTRVRTLAGGGASTGRGPGFVLPLLAFMVVCFDLPLVSILTISVWGGTGPTLAHYAELFGTDVYRDVFANTFLIAGIATAANVAIAYPLAYWMRLLPPFWRNFALALVVLPFWVSVLVRTYAWIVVLGNAGIVNRGLLAMGAIDEPVRFLYNEVGVTIGTVNILLPFIVLPLYAAMERVDPRLMQAAATLGASRRQIFLRIFLPLTLPALGAGALLVFILTLGFYVTPAILGGGRVAMISNMVDILINQVPRWELASAISIALLVSTLALYAVYRRLDRSAA
jgi:putative spermidine/putrescine transport system permease protein